MPHYLTQFVSSHKLFRVSNSQCLFTLVSTTVFELFEF